MYPTGGSTGRNVGTTKAETNTYQTYLFWDD
jgi:hypothetical protein